jgi:MATE family multidrug resistance protein
MLFASCFIVCFYIPACWTLVYKLELGSIGAAVAFCASTWLNVILLGFYVIYSSAFEKTRVPFSKDALLGISEFYSLAIPSSVMVW